MGKFCGIGSLLQNIYGVGIEIKNGNNIVRGGGRKGIMPRPVVNHDNSNDFAMTRFELRQAWNTNFTRDVSKAVTPFRAINNAGDTLSRVNYSCGGSCQSFQSRPGLKGLSQRFGAIHSLCDNSGIPPATCNGKYVYDSSDYIKFARQQAENKTYNDLNFGGDQSNASQQAIKAIRRF
jgi:hypothetical protein